MASSPHITRLTLEYDGRDFNGWATQPGCRTVQAELERALGIVLRRERVPVTVAGRTDTGVHALAQVVSYEGPPAPAHRLNALLPDDIAVLDSRSAPPGFSARHDATSRAYRYRLLARRSRSAHERGRALWWPNRLDRDALRACAAAVVGTHDFTAFTPSETVHVRFVREVMVARWVEEGTRASCGRSEAGERPGERIATAGAGVFALEIEADAFLRSMIRVLVGTMLEVGGGRRSFDDFVSLLEGAPRSRAGATAAPHGLYLIAVGYDGRPALR
ncbi:MAG TPA: tRNA pseudouridine(38-40) synthase TruA [Conexibacter sp.]